MKKTKGKFITFEGSEGSGKSTQAKFLVQYLRSRGKQVVFLREPGGTKVSEKIRKILLDKNNHNMCSLTEMLLYMAARAQIVRETISPFLKKGYIIICDRFLDSTVAYQGYGLGVNLSLIRHLANFVTLGINPDLTIFLDVAVLKGLRACGKKLDRIEQRALVYHQRVRRAYLKLAAQYPRRIKIIKPDKDKMSTQAKIRKLILRYGL
ncbi:MAG: dTMP kinase [Candidatus Omnitrophica bacterium]|nr:dTMP kinase [Candidatus Omnitrophota bacterium]